MALVTYSSSEDDEPVAKKRRLSDDTTTTALPPLPSHFRDLYSSTVRTSTHDDPSLHGGRKRVTPHVAGNWPAHVYLEWNPNKDQQKLLSDLISKVQNVAGKDIAGKQAEIKTLLENDLGVQVPLHVSLSRPLTLKTAQKDKFLTDITTSITATNIRAFTAEIATLKWHPNEDRTRWFLVFSLRRPANDELRVLLGACNVLAGEFGQPLLYQKAAASRKARPAEPPDESFHVSVAWSLKEQTEEVGVQDAMMERLKGLNIDFEEVKVRIGQDVTGVALKKRRGNLFGTGNEAKESEFD